MKIRLLCLSVLITGLFAQGQVRADFMPDRQGDCSPATIRFSNNSTGTSPATRYLWDFGNGNTSALRDAAAVFINEGSYNVKLTVTEGGQTSTKTTVVKVYKKPVVDFHVPVKNVCIPEAASFSSSSVSADGLITGYQWDFGDGQTAQTSSAQTGHYYNYAQSPTVSLTAITSYGCTGTIVKSGMLEIHPELRASFQADKTISVFGPA